MFKFNWKYNVIIGLVVSVAILSCSSDALAVQAEVPATQTSSEEITQTPSDQIAQGALDVIKVEISGVYGTQTESDILLQAKDLINGGVSPGTVVTVVKLVMADSGNADDLGSELDKMGNYIENGLPSGIFLKSLKTDYELPDKNNVEPPWGLGAKNSGEDSNGKGQPEDLGPPDGAGPLDGDKGGPPEEVGPPDGVGPPDDDEKGPPDNAGPPEEKGKG